MLTTYAKRSEETPTGPAKDQPLANYQRMVLSQPAEPDAATLSASWKIEVDFALISRSTGAGWTPITRLPSPSRDCSRSYKEHRRGIRCGSDPPAGGP